MTLRTEAEAIVESVLQHHLPIRIGQEDGDYTTMCMCHAKGHSAVFDGPVFYRQHVAALVMHWLDRGEREPSLFDEAIGRVSD